MSADARCVGTPITDASEVLSRVASDLKGTGGEPARAAFVPSKSHFVPGSDDNGGLSTKRPTQSPRDAYNEYLCAREGRRALGVLGVSVGGFKEAGKSVGHDLPIYDDGGIDPNPDHHASVWYPLEGSSRKRTEASARTDRQAGTSARESYLQRSDHILVIPGQT
jgi:hypothetical protein